MFVLPAVCRGAPVIVFKLQHFGVAQVGEKLLVQPLLGPQLMSLGLGVFALLLRHEEGIDLLHRGLVLAMLGLFLLFLLLSALKLGLLPGMMRLTILLD